MRKAKRVLVAAFTAVALTGCAGTTTSFTAEKLQPDLTLEQFENLRERMGMRLLYAAGQPSGGRAVIALSAPVPPAPPKPSGN
jgi:hypothetical protein